MQDPHQPRPPIGLTLIPPTPVTDKISLEIRAGLRNRATTPRLFEVSIYLDVESPAHRLHHERVELAGLSAACVKLRWPTAAQAGDHTLILVVASGAESWRTHQPLTILASATRSPQRLGGAWAGIRHWSDTEGQYWNSDISRMTEEHWRQLVRGMHEVGLDVINIQEIFRHEQYAGRHAIETEGYQGRAFYPSALYPGRMPIAAVDPLEAIFDEADRLRMQVLPGIGLYAWFDYSPASLQWHLAVADEIWERYGHHSSFYGWKISEEGHGSLGSRTWEPGPILDQDRLDVVDFFRGFGDHVRQLAPYKPVMVARSTHGMRGAEASYRKLLPHLDILCAFCFHRMPPDDMTGEEAADMLQTLCDETGAHLWMNMELFLFENGGNTGSPLIPRPIADVRNDLLRFPNFEKILCYQYPGLMTHPNADIRLGGDPAVKLYNDYRDFLTETTNRK